jgi:hypothetical protein
VQISPALDFVSCAGSNGPIPPATAICLLLLALSSAKGVSSTSFLCAPHSANIRRIVVRLYRISAIVLFFFAAFCIGSCVTLVRPLAAQPGAGEPAAKPPVIVIGFVGGWVNRNNSVHREVQLAAALRRAYSTGIYAQVFENHRAEDAREQILHLLDADRDGTLSSAEKRNAQIIIYGHSWGASETVALARSLDRDGIPVLLTIQVDSVTKLGENDALIPANVAEAINFYQPDGLLHGTPEIRAANPARTKVLGNFRFDYKTAPVAMPGYPWIARTFEKTHIEIESDPRVWDRIDSMIRSRLPVAPAESLGTASAASPR